jgi:flagellar biosynthesis protein FlhG
MLAGPKPRICTFLSAAPPTEKSAMLVNLSASLAQHGNAVVLLDACAAGGVGQRMGVQARATLLDVARQQRAFNQVVQAMPQGFHLASLSCGSVHPLAQDANQLRRLANTFNVLASQSDILLVDAELDEQGGFPVAAMAAGDIVVQVTPGATSVKDAYALIKRLSTQAGRRPFGVLVTGAGEREAATIYQNMARAASRYLALELYSIGFIPSDEHVTRAARLGRAVVDAFPLAGASVAFRRLAEQLSSRVAAPVQRAEAGA